MFSCCDAVQRFKQESRPAPFNLQSPNFSQKRCYLLFEPAERRRYNNAAFRFSRREAHLLIIRFVQTEGE